MPTTTDVFDLPRTRAEKADPALIADDERHFAALAAHLKAREADIAARLAAARRAPGGAGQAALDRDLEIHRLSGRLRMLQRYGLDLCLGRMVREGDPAPSYIGRLGLVDESGDPILIDWRAPAAEPFFAASHGAPMGLASRRRYRWNGGRISDYWDEVFTPGGLVGHAALDDQSAFIASLGATRSGRMRDVLATIAADQDAVVRADFGGALVVDGGPGTGKTVVALHRAAYLLYADPRLRGRRGGVLVVGPHAPYLAYVADVLPSLGEEGVATCTLRDLLPEGADAAGEPDPEVARLKASPTLVAAIDPAVRFYEEMPAEGMTVGSPAGDLWLGPADWAEAFDAPEPGAPHNEARGHVVEALLNILVDKGIAFGTLDDSDPDVDPDRLRASLAVDRDLRAAVNRAWPVIEPGDLVADLWSVPAYLRLCAPDLTRDQVTSLQRRDPRAWTTADLPLLDAARARLGDPDAAAIAGRRDAARATERARMADVIDHLIASDDGEGLVTMLRHEDLQEALVDEAALPGAAADRLAGPFAHIVVDEAQELTDAEWQMVLRRCPSRSLTIVGDRAQARHGFSESWAERLARVGVTQARSASLTINYRTPLEVMAAAEPAIRSVLPDANVPVSVRRSGIPVRWGVRAELDEVVADWLAGHAEGTACVIGAPRYPDSPRVRSLAPELAKGLEFDLVVLVDPDGLGTGIEGAVDRYVAMTRATQSLVVLSG